MSTAATPEGDRTAGEFRGGGPGTIDMYFARDGLPGEGTARA